MIYSVVGCLGHSVNHHNIYNIDKATNANVNDVRLIVHFFESWSQICRVTKMRTILCYLNIYNSISSALHPRWMVRNDITQQHRMRMRMYSKSREICQWREITYNVNVAHRMSLPNEMSINIDWSNSISLRKTKKIDQKKNRICSRNEI